jgi:hypothetical protein
MNLRLGAAAAAVLVVLLACSDPPPAGAEVDAAQVLAKSDAVTALDAQGDTSQVADSAGDASDAAVKGEVAERNGKVVRCKGKNEDGECDLIATCGTGDYCDPCTKKCVKERLLCDPCSDDVQCKNAVVDKKPGSACLAYKSGGSFCGLMCLSNAGCPKGFSCVAVEGVPQKQCVPNTGSCAPGSGACSKDGDCPFQFVCSSDWKACVKGCTADGACAQGLVCSLGHCVDPCKADGDCEKLATGAKCDAGHCKFPGGCLSSLECPDKETHCNLATHKCEPGCKDDADCKDAYFQCEGSKCVKKGCDANWQCPYAQVCDVKTGQCQPMTGLHCAKCDPEDKEVKACGGKPNLCFKMQDAQGNDKGAFCGLTCDETAPGGPCPQGWACKELKDDKGASQGKFCLRPCYSEPVDN